MVRADRSLSGTHLLCAVGRYQEACSQVVFYLLLLSSGRTFWYSCFRNKISSSLKFEPMTSNVNIYYYHFTKERKMELDHILYQIYRTSFYLYVSCILLIKLPNIEELYMIKWLNGA